MIPVDQATFRTDTTRGDCLRACIASLLELPSESVPHFVEEDDWEGALNAFLARRNLRAVWVGHVDTPWAAGPYIATGPSPRGPWGHAVLCENGELVHDPHPDRTGLVKQTGTYFLVALDPAKQPVL